MLILGCAGGSFFDSAASFCAVELATAAAGGTATPATAVVMDTASCSLMPGAPDPAASCVVSALAPLAVPGIDDAPGLAVEVGAVASCGVSGVALMFISWETGRGAAGALVAGSSFGGETAMVVVRSMVASGLWRIGAESLLCFRPGKRNGK